jgi:hypothetical protein
MNACVYAPALSDSLLFSPPPPHYILSGCSILTDRSSMRRRIEER